MIVCTRCHFRGKTTTDKIHSVPVLNNPDMMDRSKTGLSSVDVDLCRECRVELVRLVTDSGFLVELRHKGETK